MKPSQSFCLRERRIVDDGYKIVKTGYLIGQGDGERFHCDKKLELKLHQLNGIESPESKAKPCA